MSEDHSIARSIAQHLRALRLQISRSQITWIDFALSAARLYIADHKPMRAAALLATLTELDQEQRLQAALLEAAIESAQDSGHKSCSLTMIVCDEGDNIVSCLDTVDAIMDELVICDTGSTDDTVGKARMYGATIVYHEWEQDFSKARNAAIDHARGDWIFWMDADDRLEAPSAHTLQTLWRTGSAQAAAVRIRSLVAKGGEVEFMQVRLFPRHHRLRFERRIHEQIMFAVQRQAIAFSHRPEVTIVHTGYADKAMVYRKSLRNKELLQLELACEHDSTDPTLLMNMGDCHLKLGERGDAQTCYARICAQPDAYHRNSDVFVQAHINLATLYMKEGRCREASRFLLRSLFLDPTRTESHLRLGKIYLKRGMHRKAADHFLKAARIHPPLRLTASNTTMVRLNAIWHLADIYIQAGHYQEAETVLEAALQSYPQVPRFYSQRGDIRRLSGDLVQAARYYSQALTLSPTCNEQAYLGMAAVYRSLGDLSTARTFLTRGLSFHPQSGELRDALEAVADRRGQLQTV